MVIFNSYVKLPEGTKIGQETLADSASTRRRTGIALGLGTTQELTAATRVG